MALRTWNLFNIHLLIQQSEQFHIPMNCLFQFLTDLKYWRFYSLKWWKWSRCAFWTSGRSNGLCEYGTSCKLIFVIQDTTVFRDENREFRNPRKFHCHSLVGLEGQRFLWFYNLLDCWKWQSQQILTEERLYIENKLKT